MSENYYLIYLSKKSYDQININQAWQIQNFFDEILVK